MTQSRSKQEATRRTFLKQGVGAAVGTAALSTLSQGVFAAGNDVIKVGLIGCGGRGTGAAANALRADPNNKLVAMCDIFMERLENSLQRLKKNKQIGDRVVVDDDHKFTDFDGYKKLIDCVDVVLLATPPHFRPMQLKAAVEAGKHCFVEKPVAVDPKGVRSVMETCELAKKKGLSIVSGLCWRYHYAVKATFEQIHKGAIGDIVAMQCSYNSQGVWDPRRTREQCKSDMEYQIWNWYYYTWLSGDHIVEQHIHSLDKMLWAMNDQPPKLATAVGGRQVRTAPKYGNIYDHFAVVFEWDNGVKAFSRCRHWRGCPGDVTDHIMGTKGVCHIYGGRTVIEGETNWRYKGKSPNMYDVEHVALFKSIREGKPINNGDYMCKSTLMAIMGRMAAYTGQKVTWDFVLKQSKLDLSPPAYVWGPLKVRPVAVPGVTKLV